MVLAWENLRRFLWCWSSFCCCCCCCYSSFVDLFHSHFLFNIIPHPFVDYRQVFKTHFELSAQPRVIRDTFIFQPFRYLLTLSATVLSGHFLPTDVFYLMLLPDIFGTFPTLWHNLLLSRFHWEPAANFLKVAGLHNDSPNTDPAHLFVWFTVIHNLLYILTSYLCMSILQEFLLVVKTLIRSAATLFSNHENIK